VGPVWRGGKHGEHELLACCYRSCFGLAQRYGANTLAFPAISTGAYAFPLENACRIALDETLDFLGVDESIEKVTFACFSEDVHAIYRATLAALDPK
ncbi:MAG: macro domain-containing protein, partial [Burkholderiales bacterium]